MGVTDQVWRTGRLGPIKFSAPSRDLVFEMLNVPREEWRQERGQSTDSTLDQAVEDLQADLLGTIADFAFAAIERGKNKVDLSETGKFSRDFRTELMRTLPIDPYIAPEALRHLHDELLELARFGSVQASWGRLGERDGNLEILLSRQYTSPKAAR